MVSPHNEADEADGNHRVGHPKVAEDRLAGERADHVAYDTESRQDHDVHFRVTKEPEQMLEQHRVAAFGTEETSSQRVVSQQHRNRAAQYRDSKQQQECCNQHRPSEQRHTVQGHARCAHVQDRRDEVDRTHDRRCTRHVERENRQGDRHTFRLRDG